MIVTLLYKLIHWLEKRENGEILGAFRSNEWPRVRNEHIRKFPICAVCGKKDNLTVHHKKPFHLFRELELQPENLVTLCESAGMNCHITFGHKGNFKRWNPFIDEDIIIWKTKILQEP